MYLLPRYWTNGMLIHQMIEDEWVFTVPTLVTEVSFPTLKEGKTSV